MSLLPTSAAQALAAASQVERVEARDREARQAQRTSPRGRLRDETDLYVATPDAPEAVRALKGNEQEEAHEDRQETQPDPSGYGPDGRVRGGPSARPPIDLKG